LIHRRTHKYGARPTVFDGVKYASRAEAARARELDALFRAGKLRFWYSQPRFRLGVPENRYIADFLIIDRQGRVWVEDIKGVETDKFKHDRKLWLTYGPCPLHVLRWKRGKWVSEVFMGGGDAKEGV